MKLIRAKYINWCQHPKKVIDFADGLNAIRGPNGSGKTNLLTGIVFGLTGDFSRNPGLKVDNIYQLAPKDERSGVILDLVHGDNRLTLERNLRPNSQKLIIQGENKPITKSDEINEKIQELLGVNERLLLDYVFVDQWKIFSFIDQSPSVRAKAFGQLFNAEKAEVIYRMMGEFKVDVPVPAIDGDKVRIRIAETKNEINQVQLELSKFNHLPEKWNYDDDPLRNIIKQHEYKGILAYAVSEAERMIDTVNSNITNLETVMLPLQKELQEWEAALENSRIAAEQGAAALASWNAYEQVAKARAMLENEVQQLTKELEAKQEPSKPSDYCGPLYNAARDRLIKFSIELANDIKLLDTFNPQSGIAACPTCSTPVAAFQDKINYACSHVNHVRSLIANLNHSIENSKAYDAAVIAHADWVASRTTSLETAKVRLLQIGEAKQPDMDREELQQLIDDYQQLRTLSAAHTVQLSDYRSARQKLEGKLSSLDTYLLKERTAHDEITVSPEQAAAAKIQLDQKQEQLNLRNNLRYRLSTKMQLLRDDEAALQKFQLDERKANKLRRLVGHLDDVRGVFKELPQVAAQACLDSMVEEVNDVLEKFDAPFRVTDVSKLKFTVRKHNGVTMPAERLSGGEKAVFALAFRIVVNSKFAGSLGLLCLDEPTAGLDEDNITCLEVALGRLRELSTSRGLQVVLITHETGLDGLFDRVIELSSVH